MAEQNNLFDDLPIDPYLGQSKDALSLTISLPKLGEQQRIFNDYLAKIEKSSQDLEALKQLELTHGAERRQKLRPLEQQMQALHEKVVLQLDARLQTPKGLSKKQYSDVSYVAAVMVDALAAVADSSGVPLGVEVQAVVNRLCEVLDDDEDMPTSMAAAARAAPNLESELAEVKRMMSRMTGIDIEDDFGEEAKTPEELMALVEQKLREKQETTQQAYQDKRSKRKKSAKQQKAQEQAQQESMDADTALRTIYRKLASALHPDREPDEAERLRKTQLMGQVNAANDAKDLLTLLRLQLQVEQINPLAIAIMADDKLKSFNRMLKEQFKTVQHALLMQQERLRYQWQLSYGFITGKSVETALRARLNALRQQNQFMQQELQLIQDDKYLKSWVRTQLRDLEASQSYGADWL